MLKNFHISYYSFKDKLKATLNASYGQKGSTVYEIIMDLERKNMTVAVLLNTFHMFTCRCC